MEFTEDAILRLLATVDNVPKPIGQIVRSGEGGEHLVWVIDDAFVLRIRADGQDDTLLRREEAILAFLKSLEHKSTIIPTCLGIGVLDDDERRPYGLYRKVAGVSIESSPHSVNATTEEDLARMLLLLRRASTDSVRGLGLPDAEPADLSELRRRALNAWQRLTSDNGRLGGTLARGVDIGQALRLPESAVNSSRPHERPVLVHADLKGEHVFVDPNTGHLTGVIDWSDACVGHPSVDIHGLAISVGAAAASRIARRAGYDDGDAVVARGAFTARCDSIIRLDAILHGNDDSPEWLVRLQLERALEPVQ
ncbi:transferase [Cordyceps javanica]|uniref:Transferase n=1 Tax=Cordyceps javanica TaxID=43265 RepID=A0A545VT03_9HYPO|nr:transferase [Cordyceps javanica]TQW04805.1 transferase [Cordyceps javanica]